MTREEQIIKASHLYAKAQQKPFIDGAKWADEHPSPTWIEKAEKWLLNNLPKTIEGYDRYFPRIDFIEYFKKAMEEK